MLSDMSFLEKKNCEFSQQYTSHLTDKQYLSNS